MLKEGRITIKTGDFIATVIAFLLAIGPMMKYYNVPGTSLSMTSLMIMINSIFIFIYYSKRIINNQNYLTSYLLLTGYIFLISVFIGIMEQSLSQIYVFIFLFLQTAEIFMFSSISGTKNTLVDTLIKFYLTFCVMLSLLALTEEIVWFLTKEVFVFKFPLPLTEEYAKLDHRFGYNGRGSYIGFSPFFSEPSHMAQYLLPSICILLSKIRTNENKSLKLWVKIGIISAAIIITTSSFGLVVLAFILMYYMMRFNGKAARTMRRLVLIVGVFVIAVLLLGETKDSILSYGIETILSGFESGNDKTTYRVFRGFAYYFQFPISNKLFGIGFMNLTSFIMENNLFYEYEIISKSVVSEYLNGISQALVYGGLIGFSLLVMFLWKLYKKTTYEAKLLVIVLCLLYLTTGTFLRGTSVFYIIMIIAMESKNQIDRNRKGSDRW